MQGRKQTRVLYHTGTLENEDVEEYREGSYIDKPVLDNIKELETALQDTKQVSYANIYNSKLVEI